MKAYIYRILLWEFISASDSGDFDSLDIEQVKRHANDGTISTFLIDRFADYDFSVIEPQDWKIINETWANIANAVDARRKFGVENKGLSLLMAYSLQSMQMLDRQEEK